MREPVERDITWLGGRRFWTIVAVALALAVAWLCFGLRGPLRGDPGLVRAVLLEVPSGALRGESVPARVLVHDLRSGAPVAGEPVELLVFGAEGGEQKVGSGVTDAAGEWLGEVPVTQSSGSTLVAYLPRDGEDSGQRVSLYAGGEPATLVTTDKPLYQPGQVIHARALGLDARERPIAGREVSFTVLDPDGIKLFKEVRKTSQFGVAHADFQLAQEVKLGDYRVVVAGAGVHAVRAFEVKRYALPKGKVELSFDGAPPRGSVKASWSFGKPVAEAKVRLHRDRSDSPPFLEGRTDQSGVFRFDARASAAWGVVVAVVEAEGGTTLEGKARLAARSGSLSLKAYPENGVLVPGVPNQVLVLTKKGADPARAKLRVEPDGTWIDTDERGVALLELTPPDYGGSIELSAVDASSARASAQVHSYRQREGRALLVRTAKPTLPAGGRAPVRVLVPGGDTGSIRLGLWKDARLLSTAQAALAGEIVELSLEIPAAARGLLRLEALCLCQKGLATGGNVLLADGGGDLVVSGSFDKPRYAPGQTAILDLGVKGPAGPVKAAIGLSAVDEAFFALSDVRPDLEKRFFGIDRQVRSLTGRSLPSLDESEAGAFEAPADELAALDGPAPDSARQAALATLAQRARAPLQRSALWDRQYLPFIAKERAERVGGVAILALLAASAACFLAFSLWGALRLRRATPVPEVGLLDGTAWRAATGGLMLWFVLGLAGPWLGALLGAFVASGRREDLFTALGWLLGALVPCALQLRSVRQVRETEVGRTLPAFRRVLWFLPAGALLGHLGAAAVIATKLDWVELVVRARWHVALGALSLVAIVQLAFGFLSVARASVSPTSRGRRIGLLLSRACFLGLPVTLLVAGLVVRERPKAPRDAWDFGGLAERFETTRELESASAGAREGGTGTRAKGEEGSLGARGRFAVQGPADNPDSVPPVRVRRRFPETLLWLPELVTDLAGNARVEIPLADSITTYRVALSAVSARGELGSAALPLPTFQDFFVDVTAPATLTRGDEVALPVTVWNYLPETQRVRLRLKAPGFQLVGAAEVELTLAPSEARGTSFRVRAASAGTQALTVEATGKNLGDAVERKVAVEPDGLPVVHTVSGGISGTARASFVLPKEAIAGGTSVALKLYGGVLSQLAEALDGALAKPHGCFEQTSSTTYPNVLVLAYLKRVGVQSPEVEQKARAYIDEGYQRLLSFEVSGGGFDWFGAGPANTILSAYGLIEFHDMSKLRMVDEEMLRRTRDFLFSQQREDGSWAAPVRGVSSAGSLKSGDSSATAYVAWALAESGDTSPKLARALDLLERSSDDDPYALALIGNALAASGRTGAARERAASLARLAQKEGEHVRWSSPTRGLTQSYGESLELEIAGLTAHLWARLDVEPELRARALAWLVSKRDRQGTWSSTAATIAALRALLDAARPTDTSDQKVVVRLNGELASEVVIKRGARDVHKLVGLSERARTGDNALELEAPAGSDLSFQLVATHHLTWDSPAARSALPIGLRVGYGPASVEVGRTLTCQVEARWSGAHGSGMVLLQVGVPPGFEVETGDLDALVAKKHIARYSVTSSHVTLYLDGIDAQTPARPSFRLRAVFPVRALAPASVAYAYYQPEARVETKPALVTAR